MSLFKLLRLRSVLSRIFVSGIFILALLAGFIYLTSNFSRHAKGEARRINLAGSERARVYEIAFQLHEHLETGVYSIKEIKQTMTDFEEILYALKDGSVKWDIIPLPETPEHKQILEALLAIRLKWEREIKPDLNETFEMLAKNDRALALAYVFRSTHYLQTYVAEMENLVYLIQKNHDEEFMDFFREFKLLFVITACMYLLIFLYIRQTVIKPIKRLSKVVGELGAGNMTVRAEVQGADEFGALASAFNSMSETIEAEFKEIKTAEGKLRYLASFPEMNPNPVVECDENGAIEYTNAAARRLFKGMAKEDLKTLLFLSYEDNNKLKKEGHAYLEVVVDKAIYGKYYDYITDKDVSRIYLYDITAQKNAEEALKRYSETLEHKIKERTKELEASYLEASKYFNAIEQAAEAILITNINGIIQYANPAVTRTTGFSKADVLGKNPKLFNSGNNPPGMFNVMWKTIRSGSVWHGTVINKKKSGELYNEEMTVTPIKGLDGKLINFIAIKNDVTARVRAEEELRRKNVELEFARDEAEAANRAKSEFLANMSHELKTPLNHIMGFSELIHEGLAGPVTDKQREYSGDIMGSGAHLLLMINEILELSKIEAGQVELEFNEFDLGKMLEGVIATYREKALKHNIKTSLDSGARSIAVLADEKKLKQIVSNLLSNAFKFTPDGGSVRVSAKRGIRDLGLGVSNKELIPSPQAPTPDADFIEISVSDTGVGISEENQGKLFKSFGQLEATLTKKYQGTGLGLYLAQKLVVMHGGRIWVESKEGAGSKFTFTIALKKQTVPDE